MNYRTLFILLAIATLMVAVPTLLYLLPKLFFEWLKKFTKEQNDAYKESLHDKMKIIYKEEREPYYLEARMLFNLMMKNGMMNKASIIEFEGILDKALGSFTEYYDKRKFDNQAHRIYTKMKSIYIDVSDWNDILFYLNVCFENSSKRPASKTKVIDLTEKKIN